jgi:ParB family chromosome partitioning protein
LGRGLEALLGRVATGADGSAGPAGPGEAGQVPPPDPASTRDPSDPMSPGETAAHQPIIPYPADRSGQNDPAPDRDPDRVEVERIDSNPFQPRQDFDEADLQSLAESLQERGLLHPVVVRRAGERYQLVAGERRLRAAAKAGWSDVPVTVIEADDREVAELAIMENMQRRDLNPLEKAAAFQKYLEQYGGTQEELASRLKLDRSTVSNLIRLLELPEPVQEAVRQSKITQGHARALLPLGEEREQIAFCKRIQEEGLSVRRTEAVVQETIHKADAEPLGVIGRDGKRRPPRPQSEHVASLEQEFRRVLGAKVKITHSSGGRGKLIIHFASHEEFERLRTNICAIQAAPAQTQAG